MGLGKRYTPEQIIGFCVRRKCLWLRAEGLVKSSARLGVHLALGDSSLPSRVDCRRLAMKKARVGGPRSYRDWGAASDGERAATATLRRGIGVGNREVGAHQVLDEVHRRA